MMLSNFSDGKQDQGEIVKELLSQLDRADADNDVPKKIQLEQRLALFRVVENAGAISQAVSEAEAEAKSDPSPEKVDRVNQLRKLLGDV